MAKQAKGAIGDAFKHLLKPKELGRMDQLKAWAGSASGKATGGSLFGMWLMEKLLQSGHEAGMRGIQKEGIRGQADLASADNLYYQAALPQAQQQEEMARSALLTQISGGVIGPSLARGERRIGG